MIIDSLAIPLYLSFYIWKWVSKLR